MENLVGDRIRNSFDPCLNLRKLNQQFFVDAWTKIESSRLYFIKKNQANLRTEMYRGLMDYIHNNKINENISIGKMVILPSSFIGDPRALQQNYMDSMALVQFCGKPDLFTTTTCNPKWKEIEENLKFNETAIDRPDLVTRVFYQKIMLLKDELLKKEIFGKVNAYLYVIEFQKRGLPHIHLLLYLDDKDKIRDTNQIDNIVSAEIPDKNKNPKLYELVKQHMIHGPCGEQNKNSPCMNEDGSRCTKNFPKNFAEVTEISNSGYPTYRRRNNGRKIYYSSKRSADNSFVVPFNVYLLLLLICHINVEICSTIKAIKYLFKYFYKGPDSALVKFITKEKSDNIDSENSTSNIIYDEIEQYLSTRYVYPPEALHRIFEYKLHEQSHAVYKLAVHLENEQYVYFKESCEKELIDKNVNTTLTAWFQLNLEDPSAREYLYTEFPSYYVFDKTGKKWQKRKNSISQF
jgi:hypothetical protein